jgi:hypothetical protein
MIRVRTGVRVRSSFMASFEIRVRNKVRVSFSMECGYD